MFPSFSKGHIGEKEVVGGSSGSSGFRSNIAEPFWYP